MVSGGRGEQPAARLGGDPAGVEDGAHAGDRADDRPAQRAPGEILLYPGGFSETEILFPYGGTMFASIVGQLAGNHFLTVVEGREQLRELGRTVLWEGAQDVVFDRY